MSTILYNGHIYSKKNHFVQALVIENGYIVYSGSNEQAMTYQKENTILWNCEGKTIVPGFNDSHMHFYSTALTLDAINFLGSTSIQEVIDRGLQHLKNNPNHQGLLWGRGWNQDYFNDEKRLIHRYDLDRITTQFPVVFSRACGHVASCNSKALELLNLNKDMTVDGGAIGFDEQGDFDGVFYENAIKILEQLKTPVTSDSVIHHLKLAAQAANACGITSVQTNDFLVGSKMSEIVEEGYQRYVLDNPTVRIRHQICFTNIEAFHQRISQGYFPAVSHPFNQYGPLKIFTDGSLGARTALLKQPYHDDLSTYGLACMSIEQIDDFVSTAHQNHIQVVAHAIGDAAIEHVLHSYARFSDSSNPLRHAIIHCQITDEPQLHRFKEHNILALVQPIFLHYDLHIVKSRVGEALAKTSYAFNTMEQLGVEVAYSSDAPVEPFNVISGIHCAVNRQDLHDFPIGGFNPDECVDVATAIDSYTIKGAYASFEENIKGRLWPGYMADLVILSQDIFSVPKDQIKFVEIEKTMVNGQFVYIK